MAISEFDSNKVFNYISESLQKVDIEFKDLNYSVRKGRKEEKFLLKNVSGQFKSGQLTAILGPSGAGKTTLLNILAGYKCHGTITGSILVNGHAKNPNEFSKIARYIMQRDLIQPRLTVEEAMMMAADLKLDKNTTKCEIMKIINEILHLLRLNECKNTLTNVISGGERRRLSIALELINNPPVLFLDEPTTGLDDVSCSQCISLLKTIALEGRTVICSIHAPSAKLFTIFDRVYVISLGECVYQGYGPECVNFLSNVELECPKHYNPADFIIEICSGEYGDYQNKLVSEIENGKIIFGEEIERNNIINKKVLEVKNINNIKWFKQFCIILNCMWLQMYRDKANLLLQFIVYLFLALLISILFIGTGQDGSKTYFNAKCLFSCIVVFLYVPIMPVLLYFPTKIQILKKEYFNKWYDLSPYFCAFSFCTIPFLFIFGSIFTSIVYVVTDQPLEIDRYLMFTAVCLLTGITAESVGRLIASRLSLVNGMFLTPVTLAPCLILSIYGMGSGYDTIAKVYKIGMQFDFVRYSLKGIAYAIYNNRSMINCAEEEIFCYYKDVNFFLRDMGIDDNNYVLDVLALVFISTICQCGSFVLLKLRLDFGKSLAYNRFFLYLSDKISYFK